jgi:hypothetical protein
VCVNNQLISQTSHWWESGDGGREIKKGFMVEGKIRGVLKVGMEVVPGIDFQKNAGARET